jgi:hypothetical protein
MLKTPDTLKDGIICDALAQIRPAADRRAVCIERIKMALRLVQWAREWPWRTPARRRDDFRAVAKALHALEIALTAPGEVSELLCYGVPIFHLRRSGSAARSMRGSRK